MSAGPTVSSYIDVAVLRNVLVVALVAGVGITGLFAFGVRSMDRADRAVESGAQVRGLRALGYLAFGCVVVAVAIGVWAVLAK